jgi:tetraacyldisaccharide 4'-kinase
MKLPLFVRILLWPVSVLYSALMWLRAWLYTRGWLQQKRLDARVISVGNLTVGGTGKTPMVIWLAERFLAGGQHVAILSRGYRGRDKNSDEIQLMKARLQNRVAFGVGRDRYAEGRRLASQKIDVFLLDDGFQHLSLARDVDIVLVDSSRPLRNESVIPAGRLREPRSALHRAHLVVFTRTELSELTVYAIQKFPQFAIYPSTTKLLGLRRHGLREESALIRESYPDPVFAFCGIGNPEAFWADLERWGLNLVGRKSFRDHHRYTTREIRGLAEAAISAGAKALVTTEKDAQNLDNELPPSIPIYLAAIALELPDEAQFLRDLRERLKLAGGGVAA